MMYLRQWLLIQVTVWNLSFLYDILATGSLLEPSSSTSLTTEEFLFLNASNASALSSTVRIISPSLLVKPSTSFQNVGPLSPATPFNNITRFMADKSNADTNLSRESTLLGTSNLHHLSASQEWKPSPLRRQAIYMTADSNESTLHGNLSMKSSSAFTYHFSSLHLLSQNGNNSPSSMSLLSATSTTLPFSALSPSSSTLTISGSGQHKRRREKRSPDSVDPMDLVTQQSSVGEFNVSHSVPFETDLNGNPPSARFRNISPTRSIVTASQTDTTIELSQFLSSYRTSVHPSLSSSPSSSTSLSTSSSTTTLRTSSLPLPMQFQTPLISSHTPNRHPYSTTLASSQINTFQMNTPSSSPSSSVVSMLSSLPSTSIPSLSTSSISSSNKQIPSPDITTHILSTPSLIHLTLHSASNYTVPPSSPTPQLSSPPSSSSTSLPIPANSEEHLNEKSHLYTTTGSRITSEAIVATTISDAHLTRSPSASNVSIATGGLLASSSLQPSGSLSAGIQSSPSPSSAGYVPGARSRNTGSNSYHLTVTIQDNSSILIIMPCLVGMSLFLLMVAGYRRCQEHRKRDVLLPLSTRQMGLHGSRDTAALRRSRKSILENNGKPSDVHDNVSLTPKVIVHTNGGHSPYIQPHRFSDPLYDENGLSIDRDDRDYNKALITDGKETSQIRVFVHPHRMTPSPRKPSSSTSVGDSTDHDVSYGEINPVFQADDDLDCEEDDELDNIFLVEKGQSTRERLVKRDSVTSDVTSDGGMTSAQFEHSFRSDSHSALDLSKDSEEGANGPVNAVTKL